MKYDNLVHKTYNDALPKALHLYNNVFGQINR